MQTKEKEKCLISVRSDFETQYGAKAWRELTRLLSLRNHHFGYGSIGKALKKSKKFIRHWHIRITRCR